jgi:hypothetical protein
MAKVAFGTDFLGDGLTWLGVDYERLAGDSRKLLWSSKADVPEASANFLWHVRAVVWVKRTDVAAVSIALETLARTLGAAKADLKVYRDDGATQLRKYPSCRFDGMRRHEPPRKSRRDFEEDVEFVFTTEKDPE